MLSSSRVLLVLNSDIKASYCLYNFLQNYDLECTYWPSSKNLCSDDGEEPLVLDTSVRPSDFQKCENLCRNEGGEGCCFLTDSDGCKWKKGSVATSVSMGEQKYFAITCSFSGTIVVVYEDFYFCHFSCKLSNP